MIVLWRQIVDICAKAIDAADALWDEGLIDEETIEQWKHEHMRTPYSE